MVRQTLRPLRWIIVSDGSTDKTDVIVGEHAKHHPWIELVRMPERRDRQFAAKVHCFNAGYARVRELDYEVIGNLDADITFDAGYFEFLMAKFQLDAKLGVAGTPFVEDGESYDYRFTNIEHVSGACQMFRKKCFENIDGYIAIKGGGIDWTAVTTARMKGWKTRTFTEKVCHHHRKMGTGTAGQWRALFKHGVKDYYLGGHPLWQGFRATFQMTRAPYIAGGTLLMAGYVWAALRRMERPVSPELMRFHRAEQMRRLKAAMGRRSVRASVGSAPNDMSANSADI